MANRPKGYGMTAELNIKKSAKYSNELAVEVFEWMRKVLKEGGQNEAAESIANNPKSARDVSNTLKDGQTLCALINVIQPGSVSKVTTQKMAFKMMENINNFLNACESMGCKKIDLFQTVDLYESENISQVINGLIALGRKAQVIGYDGPVLGPSEAKENKREFTEEQLKAGEGTIGLQMGSNKFASQAGQSFGKTRSIIDFATDYDSHFQSLV